MKKFIAALFFCLPLFAFAQNAENNVGVKFSGFIKSDFFYDTRQTEAAREGHFLLYPKGEDLVDGVDINDNPSLNFLSIQTRLRATITGPDAFGAKTSGLVEGAFFGNIESDINGFRLRHAYVKLNWEKTELLFGQFWHPMFNTDCFPDVVSFNTGVPFIPFSRNPQIRFTANFNSMKFVVAAITQRDFASPGGSASLRNSAMPELHAQIQLKSGSIYASAGVGYKTLVPDLKQPEEKIPSTSASACLKADFTKMTFKMQGTVGSNLFDIMMLGGYAIDTISKTNNEIEYKPTSVASFWFEAMSKGEKLQVGLLAGYSQNLGAEVEDGNKLYVVNNTVRGAKIDNIYRISPRVVFISGKTKLCLETEYTAAAYGVNNDDLTVKDAEYFSNLRILFSVIYSF